MKNRFFKVTWLIIFLSLTLFCLNPSSVLADTSAPNLTAINETHAWRNLLEPGDYFLIARYDVLPGLNTTTNIADTFTFRLMDTTNTVELGVTEAYPYQNNGWGQGIIGFYFPASTAPTWGSSYWIRIEGKFTVFTSPPVYNYNIPATAYSVSTNQDNIRVEMAEIIIDLAKTIGSSWTPIQALTEESESGTVLSQLGESYFRPTIPGIQAMCPNLFVLQVLNVPSTNTTWSTNQSDAKGALVQNTTAGAGITGVATLFNMSFTATAAIPIIIVCIALIIIGGVQGNILSGLINSSVVLSGGSLFGWFPMGVLMLISFACGVFMLFHLIFKGS
jgi:hypothetical protein